LPFLQRLPWLTPNPTMLLTRLSIVGTQAMLSMFYPHPLRFTRPGILKLPTPRSLTEPRSIPLVTDRATCNITVAGSCRAQVITLSTGTPVWQWPFRTKFKHLSRASRTITTGTTALPMITKSSSSMGLQRFSGEHFTFPGYFRGQQTYSIDD
jgi:hypothetical protein